jgi:hypothetical protein
VTLGSLIADVAVIAGLFAIVWHWGMRRWTPLLGVVVVAAGAHAIGGVRPVLFRSPAGAVYLVASLVLGGVMAAEAIGLPSGLARRLGLGVRTPHWRFRHALWRHQRDLSAVLRVVADDEVTRAGLTAAVAAADAHVRAMAALVPPNDEWEAIRDQIVSNDIKLIDWFAAGCPPDAIPDGSESARTMLAWKMLDRTTDAPMLGAGLGRVSLAVRHAMPRLLFGVSLALVGLSELGAFPGASEPRGALDLGLPAVFVILGGLTCLSAVLPLERWGSALVARIRPAPDAPLGPADRSAVT